MNPHLRIEIWAPGARRILRRLVELHSTVSLVTKVVALFRAVEGALITTRGGSSLTRMNANLGIETPGIIGFSVSDRVGAHRTIT